MANSFLDRNKKKSSGALVLLLAWLRGRGPLVVVLVAVMGIFVAPSNFIGGVTDGLYRSPWGRPLARALSLATGRPQPESYSDIVKQLREARQQTNKTAWSLFSRGAGASNADSLGMVLGGKNDVLAAASIGGKIQGGKTINGVLSPEDSRKNGANGVELTNADLKGGFVASAAADVFAGQNLLTGGSVAPASPESSMAAAMKQARVPDSAREKMIAGREGRLSKTEFRTLQANMMSFGHQSNVGMPGSALYTLADARTRGQMSRAPTCTADNGCPPEYANTNSGAVYDGNKAGKGKVIQSAPVYGFDGASTPGFIKDQAADQDELDKIKADQRACDQADATFKPLLNPHVKRMVELSQMPRLPEIVAEQRSECRIMDQLLHQQYDACPLRHEDGPYEPQECD